ncbi:hypothetical protein RAA17_08030 [Komagataeibacter rhaeticus]|nr:hypothetical protein [Komagataeibacter rhaeticus]
MSPAWRACRNLWCGARGACWPCWKRNAAGRPRPCHCSSSSPRTEAEAEPAAPTVPPAAHALLAELDPDALSPRTALEMLYKLKN